jgi:hypothetical protein
MVLTYYEILERLDEILDMIASDISVDPYELIEELKTDMGA